MATAITRMATDAAIRIEFCDRTNTKIVDAVALHSVPSAAGGRTNRCNAMVIDEAMIRMAMVAWTKMSGDERLKTTIDEKPQHRQRHNIHTVRSMRFCFAIDRSCLRCPSRRQ